LLRPPHPTTTLFPYTTLFRSPESRPPLLLWRAIMPHAEQWARTRVRTSRQVRRGAWYRVLRATALEGVLEVNRRPVTVPRTFLQDRKSTRLNSSHVAISYAVF